MIGQSSYLKLQDRTVVLSSLDAVRTQDMFVGCVARVVGQVSYLRGQDSTIVLFVGWGGTPKEGAK